MSKILIVEDNELIREILVERLEGAGYETVTAVDGTEGLEAVQLERPDLVLMDINLPWVDGLEVSRQIRTMTDIKDTPIIALTALARSGDREACLRAGCNEYEPKPVNFPSLIKKIEKLIRPA